MVLSMVRPLTSDETLLLRAFQRQVERLRKSSILREGKINFKYSTKITFPSGEVQQSFEGYDKDAFQAQLPILRQFILQEKINFNRIHNIVNQCCERPDLLEWVGFARRQWDRTFTKLPEDNYFRNQQLSVEEATKKLFYGFGGLFHVDLNVPNEEEEVREIQEAIIQSAFPYLWNSLNNMDSVIHIWLDETTKPVPPAPPQA
jgi:hypothetical protein